MCSVFGCFFSSIHWPTARRLGIPSLLNRRSDQIEHPIPRAHLHPPSVFLMCSSFFVDFFHQCGSGGWISVWWLTHVCLGSSDPGHGKPSLHAPLPPRPAGDPLFCVLQSRDSILGCFSSGVWFWRWVWSRIFLACSSPFSCPFHVSQCPELHAAGDLG